jgi:ribosomal protein S6
MKLLAKDVQPRQYELTYLVAASYTEAELKNIRSQVVSLIEKHKGSIDATEEWGKNHLAYTIINNGVRHREAVYTHVVVTFEPKYAQAFERDIYLFETIIRHLFVKAEIAKPESTKVSEPKTAAVEEATEKVAKPKAEKKATKKEKKAE